MPNSSWLFLTIFAAFLMGKTIIFFIIFGKYQWAGEITAVYRLGDDKNKENMDEYSSVYRKIFSHLSTPTHLSIASRYSTYKSES